MTQNLAVLGSMSGDWYRVTVSRKISIITVSYNSATTIVDTLISVSDQTYDNIEHIIIDGGSTDNTKAIIAQHSNDKLIFISEPDQGIYDAMNKGINLATGDIVSVLNSDDVYANNNVISIVMEKFNSSLHLVFGNVDFVKREDTSFVTRKQSLKHFRPWMVQFGWNLAHPATFMTRSLANKVGRYNTKYHIAADYDYFVRVFSNQEHMWQHLDQTLVKIREGGISTNGMKSYINNSIEVNRVIKDNGYYSNIFIVLLRLPLKFFFQRLIK
jgi:glycosyltransferase involved in cell wall biosynthesis